MKKRFLPKLAGLISACSVTAIGAVDNALVYTRLAGTSVLGWEELAPLPDAHGFAGSFGGTAGGALLVAGGANFAQKPLAQGGRKEWHDTVFALDEVDGEWRLVGRLPHAWAYGVSGSWQDAMVLVGGEDGQSCRKTALILRLRDGSLAFESLPELPIASANAAGTVVGDTLYVAGGQQSPDALTALGRCFAINLAVPSQERVWVEVPWPAAMPPRILATAAALGECFYLFGGAELVASEQGGAQRRYLNDAWEYHPQQGWRKLADLPRALAAAPSPAIVLEGNKLLIAGGVSPQFLQTLEAGKPHPGFPATGLLYDSATNSWETLPDCIPQSLTDTPPVTTPVVRWGNRSVIAGGETAPGIRTTQILSVVEHAPEGSNHKAGGVSAP